jgi:hypothetical protein
MSSRTRFSKENIKSVMDAKQVLSARVTFFGLSSLGFYLLVHAPNPMRALTRASSIFGKIWASSNFQKRVKND